MLNQEELNQIKSRLELDKKELKSGIKAKIKNLFLDTNELTELADHSREEMNFLVLWHFVFHIRLTPCLIYVML